MVITNITWMKIQNQAWFLIYRITCNPENTIDGIAIFLAMRLLCIEKVTIYSLKPNQEQNSKNIVIKENTFFERISGWHVRMICVTGFCHYSSLI